MNSIFTAELLSALMIALIAFVIGAMFDHGLLVLCFTLFVLLVIQLKHLSAAKAWMQSGQQDLPPPDGSGLWADVFDNLYELQKANTAERDRLVSSIEYLERSFSAMQDAVIILDSEWRIDWCNRASNELLGIQAPRDYHQYLLNLLRNPNFVRFINEREFDDPYFVQSPRNPSVELEVRLSRFGNNEHLLFARDVTKIRHLDQMRRDFTDNVSHELRTPLTVISGYLDVLNGQQQLIDPKLHKALDQMSSQAERMKLLINDIIMLSKLESVSLDIDEIPINLRDMAEVLQKEALEISPDRQISIMIDDDWLVRGSNKELYSAFSNLVFNALKYTPESAKITISWQKTNLGAVLNVKDTGQGIAIEHLSRLTERFYRVDDSRNSNTGGSGLGLAIVKHIMQRHGGDLMISSHVGIGSNFACHFPNSRLVSAIVSVDGKK